MIHLPKKALPRSMCPVLAALALCSGTAAGDPDPAGSSSPGVSSTGVAAESPLDAALDCVVTPRAQIDVSSAVPGLLEEVLVERSDPVSKGQLLARLESSVEQAAAALAEGWADIDTEIRLQRVDLDRESQKRARLTELYQQRVVSLDARDESDSQVRLTELRVRQAKDRRWLRELESRKAQASLERRRVRSPVDGVVMQRYRSPGEYVDNQPVVRIVQLDPLHVETIVPMASFGAIEPGMKAAVVPEAPAQGTFEATVSLVDPVGDAASGTFGVRLELPNPDYRIPAGLKCTVRFLATPPAQATEPPVAREPPASAVRVEAHAVPPPRPELNRNSGRPGSTRDLAADLVPKPSAEPVAAVAAGLPVSALPEATPRRPAAPPPELTVGSACGTIGPVSSTQAKRLETAMAEAGANVSQRAEETAVAKGYVVLGPAHVDCNSRRAFLRRLDAHGVTDRFVMGRGRYHGRVALGSYWRAGDADKRVRALTKLDLRVESQPFHQWRVEWWLDVELPDATAARRQRIIEVAHGAALGSSAALTDCPSRLASG